MPMEEVWNMKLAKVVRDEARRLAEVVGDAKTASGKYVNDVLQIVRSRARSWIRDAYLIGYRDGLEDVIRAWGWCGDVEELEMRIKSAAAVRAELEARAKDDERTSVRAKARADVLRTVPTQLEGLFIDPDGLARVVLTHPLSIACPMCDEQPNRPCVSMAKRYSGDYGCRGRSISLAAEAKRERKTPHKERVIASREENARRRERVDAMNAPKRAREA